MALTEERSGGQDKMDFIRYVDSTQTFVLYDWLGVKGGVAPIGFDGADLLYSHVFLNKGSFISLIMKSKANSGEQVPVEIPFFSNQAPFLSGYLSADGSYLLLSAESSYTVGVDDLYVSKKSEKGQWSSMKNLGSVVNSAFQEITPFLAEDNKTLFFASNRPGGAGSFDVYYTVRLDDSWRNWSDPIRLGDEINSSGAETSFSFRRSVPKAYFIRSVDSDGYGDIYQIKIKSEIVAETLPDSPPVTQVPIDTVSGVQSDERYLQVINSADKRTIAAQFVTQAGVISSEAGTYVISDLDFSEIEIKAKGYFSKVISLDSTFTFGENIVALAPLVKGQTISLPHVLFARGTAELIGTFEKELDQVVDVLKENPTMKILVKGHTDNKGDPVKNIKLSEARARVVKDYIIGKGISAYRVSGRGFGGNQPLVSNATEASRKQNRRVEFEITSGE